MHYQLLFKDYENISDLGPQPATKGPAQQA